MVNRRAFFEIFFYNRADRPREMMEAAEGVWRAYMNKHGLGLEAGQDGQPTYEEVKEITYLANAAIAMVEKQMAEAAAEEERRKKLQKEAWELGIFPPADTSASDLEKLVLREMKKQTEEVAQEPIEEFPEEEAEETVEESAEEVVDEVAPEVTEPAEEEPPVEAVVQEPLREIPVEKKVVQAAQPPVLPTAGTDMLSLWVAELTQWCRNKGMQCITTMDGGDVYLHVYLPHKKDVHTVGKWCFQANVGGAELAAEMTQLFAYCEGFADCFEKLMG